MFKKKHAGNKNQECEKCRTKDMVSLKKQEKREGRITYRLKEKARLFLSYLPKGNVWTLFGF